MKKENVKTTFKLLTAILMAAVIVLCVTPIYNILDFSYSVSAAEVSQIPQRLKTTYDIFRSGTFRISFEGYLYSGEEAKRIDAYYKYGNASLTSKTTISGTEYTATTIYNSFLNEGNIFIPDLKYYTTLSAGERQSLRDNAAMFSPEMDESKPFITETKKYNNRTVTSEGYVSKDGETVCYYFDYLDELCGIEFISAEGVSTVLKVIWLDDEVGDSILDKPEGFPSDWTDVGSYPSVDESHIHYDTNVDNLCDECDEEIVSPIEIGKCGDYAYYKLYEGGRLVIGGLGVMGNNENKAYNLADKDIKTVVINEGVTSVGVYAFKDCTSITNVSFSKSITTIDNYGFAGCTGITKLDIPEGVVSIGSYTFRNCKNLTDVKIADGLLVISVSAFEGCEKLVNINIPESVISFSGCVFFGCTSLEEIKLPENQTTVKIGMFEGCTALKSFTAGENINMIDMYAFCDCSNLEELYILNPECEIYDLANTIYEGTTIYGYANSPAQAYAEKYGRNFKIICNHINAEYYEATPPTCEEVGYTEGKYCDSCKEWISGHEEIPETGHDWKDATCTWPKQCRNCFVSSGDSLGHDEVYHDYKSPTCTEPGCESYTICLRCGFHTTYSELPPLGHNWKEATCTDPKTCSRCKIAEGEAKGHTEEIIPEIPPTCMEKGWTEGKKCSVCRKILVKPIEKPAKGHIEVVVPRVEPTCCKNGYTEKIYCSECGYVIKPSEEITLILSLVVSIPGKEPTCTEDGYTEGTKCRFCQDIFSEPKVIKALGHKWNDATCTEPKTCSVCGATEGTASSEHTWVAATCTYPEYCSVCEMTRGTIGEHSWVEANCDAPRHCTACGIGVGDYAHEWKDATCYTPKTCSLCGATSGKALGHRWKEASCTDPETCYLCGTTQGNPKGHFWTDDSCTTDKICLRCGEMVEKAPGHKIITVEALPATCTDDGYTESTQCDVCREYFKEPQVIEAPGHSFDIVTVIKEADCFEPGGEILYECSRCHETKTENTLPLGHNFVTVPGKEPTCTEKGYTESTKCTRCGETSEPRTIKALGHTEVAIPAVSGGCTEPEMSVGKMCSVCGEILEEPYEMAPEGHMHHWVKTKEETCFEDGFEIYKCDKCGDVSEERIIPKLNHDSVYIEYPKTATCTEDGTTGTVMCDKCNTIIKEPEITKAYGHQFVSMPEKMATCTEAGLEIVRCAYCGLISEEKVIPAKGHREIIEGKCEPTCTSDGNTGNTVCEDCHIVLKEGDIIPKKGHTDLVLEGRKPTCTEEGITDGINCGECGVDLIMQETIPAKGHTEVVIPAVPATYTKSGKTEGKECSVCGEILVAQKKVSRKKLKKVTSLKVKKTTSSSVTLSWKKVTDADSYKVYYSTNGKKWKSIKVTKNSATIKKLSSAKNYQFKVRAFAGKYYGEASKVVKATTKFTTASLTKVNSTKKKQTTVAWKQVKNASGYVVEYSTSKKFTKKTTKTVTVKNGKTTKTTLKKLKSGKKYYVRVKAYKTVNKKAVYGEYSKVKTVKVK